MRHLLVASPGESFDSQSPGLDTDLGRPAKPAGKAAPLILYRKITHIYAYLPTRDAGGQPRESTAPNSLK